MALYLRGKVWWMDITLGGVRLQEPLKQAKNRSQALRIQEDLRSKFRNKQLHIEDLHPLPLAFAAKHYLEYCKAVKSERTYELEFTDYKKHLHPALGSALMPLSADILKRYQTQKKKQGYANRTVNIHIGLVRKILHYAKEKKYIHEINFKFPMLPESQKTAAFLSPKELPAFLRQLSYSMAYRRSLFGICTGLRPAELAYLSWDDIDLAMRTARIRSKPPAWTIKTKQERVVPLNNTALRILRDLRKERKGPWVFSTGPKPVKSIRKALDTAATNAGIKRRITPNMLRHTFATHALMRGADIKSVSEILGHSSIETTMKYLHAIKEQLQRTVGLMDLPGLKTPTFPLHSKKKDLRKSSVSP